MSRYCGYFIHKETRSSVKHSHQVLHYFYKSIIYKTQQHSTRIWSSNETRAIYKPTYIQLTTKFTKTPIFYQFQSNIQPKNNIFLKNSTLFWHSPIHVWSFLRIHRSIIGPLLHRNQFSESSISSQTIRGSHCHHTSNIWYSSFSISSKNGHCFNTNW